MDSRILLHAGGSLHDHLDGDHELDLSPAIEAAGWGAADVATGADASPGAAKPGPTVVPVLNSLQGAPAALYLDFDGHAESRWGAYRNITNPAFDQDGDATTFSDAELSAITLIWQYVAEDYAPFNINVTTVLPASFADGVAARVAIGGGGAWAGGGIGGISYVDSFTNSTPNTAFVFSEYLAKSVKYIAEAASHEAGHGFGLQHQSLYSDKTLVAEYYAGPGDGRAPVMGNSYSATRGLWWYGPTTSSTTIQDDLAVLSRSLNRFGYRADDRGNTATSATPLAASGTQLGGAGLIETTSDVDYFSFTTAAGSISLAVDVPAGVNNLDARLELRDDAGTTLLASADPGTGFGATVTATVAAGSYRLVVASHGGYGDVGQYTVRGTVAAASSTTIAAPTGLTATAVSTTQVNLAWTDRATNETGYRVERSSDGGTTWISIGTAAANAVASSDTAATAGTAYQYRVRAFNGTATSDSSNVAAATTITVAPAGLTATAASSGQINLSWGDVAGETGFQVERSSNGGASWAQVGTTGAGVTTLQNTGLTAGTTYQYRVKAVNAGGASAASNVASATTPAAPAPPAAPTGLVAAAASKTRVNLSWTDNSGNESGFKIERSTNAGKSWTQIAQVGANVTAYADLTVTAGKSYSFRVRSSNAAGNSSYSNVASVTTPKAASAAPVLDVAADDPAVAAVPPRTAARPSSVIATTPSGVPARPSGDVPLAVVVDHALAAWSPIVFKARRLKKASV